MTTKTSLKAAASPNPAFLVDRRALLRAGSSALVVGFTVALPDRPALAGSGTSINAYIQIDADGAGGNIVTLYSGSTEMGQGIMTGLAQLAAEELKVPFSQMRVEHGVPPAIVAGVTDPFTGKNAAYANPLFGSQLTGGSTSLRGWFTSLRVAAATAREMLRSAAASAAFLNTSPSNIVMANGTASYNSQSFPYSALAASAATLPLPNPLPQPSTSDFQIIGQSVPRVDIPDKVKGTAVFGIDVNSKTAPNLAGMVYAAVQHCPTIGGTVGTMPAKPAGALAVVNLTNAVAVVATDTWTAMKLADALKVTWSIPASSSAIDTANIKTKSLSLLQSTAPAGLQTIETVGTPDAAFDAASIKINSTYQLPHLAHACMEPLNCTAVVTPTSCDIWAPTQGQRSCIATAISVLKTKGITLTESQVKVRTTMLGGGLGRKIEQDYIAQAILTAHAVGKPVKLTWSRVQDFKNDKFRPCAFIQVKASYDAASNTIPGWVYRNVASSISQQSGSTKNDTGGVAGATGLKYPIINKRTEFVPNNVGVPLGYWRSVGESYNVFAVESAIDELALAAGQTDPLAFRRSLLSGDSRSLAVLDAVAAMSNWSSAPAAGRQRGVAYMAGFGSVIALVAEVSKNATTGRVVVNTVYCAIDCGTVVNPDIVVAQIEGGVAHGLGATLWGQATFTAGKSNLTNFNSYPVVKLGQMPTVAVKLVDTGSPVGGVGETAVPCVAPAVANAFAKLTGTRVRTLPFYPGSTMGGL